MQTNYDDYRIPPPGKFESTGEHYELAKYLYGHQPDEEAGSVDYLGWYGLYRTERVILTEATDGAVYIHVYDPDEDLEADWATCLALEMPE